MARETKVGLLVGLGVILLIGIIVSDHLSVVQTQEPAEMTDFGPRAQRSVSTSVLRELPREEAEETQEMIVQEPAPSEPGHGRPPQELQAMAPAAFDAPPPAITFSHETIGRGPLPAARTEPSSFTILPRQSLPEVAPVEPIEARALAMAPPAAGTPGAPQATPASGGFVASGNAAAIPTIGAPASAAAATPVSTPAAAAPAAPAAPAVQPLATHTVQRGDSVYRIAGTYYGSGESWRLIQQANPGRVGPDWQLREGVQLVIPQRPAAATTAAAPPPSQTPVAPAVQVNAPTPQRHEMSTLVREAPDLFEEVPGGAASARTAAPATVEVQAGETLGALAARHLGSSRRWPELLAANKDQLKTPEELRAGMRLRLPAAAAPAQAAASAPPAPPAQTAAAPAAAQARTIAAGSPAVRTTYTVQASDTLSSIAARTLGDRGRWNEIYAANRDQLSDPGKVRPGQVLILPASVGR